jgi:hypothetical protein
VLPEQPVYLPENTVNGYSRPYGLPNLWISAVSPDEEEQWISFLLPQPRPLAEICVTFNTTLETDGIYGFPQLVRRYWVEIEEADGQKRVLEAENPGRRYCRHAVRAKAARKVTIFMQSTFEQGMAEIYSVKLF